MKKEEKQLPASLTPPREVQPEFTEEDLRDEVQLRPQSFKEYIGQEKVKKNLQVFIEAARTRQEALDHVLFSGPPGLGKTTLAYIIAAELGVNIRATSGPVLERPGDVAAILSNLREHDLLFIDEIHRLNHVVEEILYPGHGGFSDRHPHRPGAQRPFHQAEPSPFHPRGGHDPRRSADLSPAGPLRHQPAPGILLGCGTGRDRHPVGPAP